MKFLIISKSLFIFFNLKNFYVKVFPPETLKLEEYINFKDVKSDGFFVYFLTHNNKVVKVNPYKGIQKSEFTLNSLTYATFFDVTERNNYYFYISKGSIPKVLKIKFSPFDSSYYFFDIDERVLDFFVIEDSFFIFVFKEKIHIYKKLNLFREFKKSYKNYFKLKDEFYVYSGDTLFSLIKNIKKEYKGNFELLFKTEGNEIVYKDNFWSLR
ncbi:MAG: hypothetical protein ABDH37_05985 [Candidatus Hydrothermales bacterium]